MKDLIAVKFEAKKEKKALLSEIIGKPNDRMGREEEPLRRKTISDNLIHKMNGNAMIQKQVGANTTTSHFLMGDLTDK